jgi:hypothetical protein
MAIAFRGLFYFAAKGLWKSGLKGQHRVPSGVKRVRLFHTVEKDVYVAKSIIELRYKSNLESISTETISQ